MKGIIWVEKQKKKEINLEYSAILETLRDNLETI